jgi:hypothetical protein
LEVDTSPSLSFNVLWLSLQLAHLEEEKKRGIPIGAAADTPQALAAAIAASGPSSLFAMTCQLLIAASAPSPAGGKSPAVLTKENVDKHPLSMPRNPALRRCLALLYL